MLSPVCRNARKITSDETGLSCTVDSLRGRAAHLREILAYCNVHRVTQPAKTCPFCSPSPERVLLEGSVAMALWDSYPLNLGHVLLVPRRHVASWFEATATERDEMLRLADDARQIVLGQHSPDGFNLGINDGAAAGQTVPHLHLHLIPRYRGDMPDPRGGVRWIIPDRAVYWSKP